RDGEGVRRAHLVRPIGRDGDAGVHVGLGGRAAAARAGGEGGGGVGVAGDGDAAHRDLVGGVDGERARGRVVDGHAVGGHVARQGHEGHRADRGRRRAGEADRGGGDRHRGGAGGDG